MSSETEKPLRGSGVATEGVAELQFEGPALARILGQQAAVAQFAQHALTEGTLQALLSEAVTVVARVLETELVSIAQIEANGKLRVVAGTGWRPGVVGQLELAGGAGSQSGYTLATGGPLIVDDLSAETRFTVVPVLVEHSAVSGVSARIGDPQQPFGVISAFTGQRGRFSRDDAAFLQAMASVLAGAVRRLRVESELRRSRDELSAIVGTVRDGILVRGAGGRLLYANEPAARMNRFASAEAMVAAGADASTHYSLSDEHGRPIPEDELPSRKCLRTGRQTPETLVHVRWHDTGEERWQVIQASPVQGSDGRVEKVVVVIRDTTDQHRALEARHFLTEALATLSSILDRAEQARQLAQLCVPRLADYCSIDLLEAYGSIQPAAISHVEPDRESQARRLRRSEPIEPDEETGPARVIREARPEFVAALGTREDGAEQASRNVRLLLALGMSSSLCVPLLARGRPIGTLTLARAAGSPALDSTDLGLAEELGARAGVLLENAGLYVSAEERRSELDAVLAAMADAMLVFDARGRLRLTNRAADVLFGGGAPRTVDQLRQHVQPDGGGQPAPGWTDPAAEAEPSTALAGLEGELQMASSGRWYELRSYRSRRTQADHGERHGPFVVVLRDITEPRAARAAREAFLGVLSHELRTPITTIYGGSELLTRSLDEERRAEVLRDIRVESERLARLVEDLLVMSRVERGGVEIGDEPVLMQRLVPGVISSVVARHPGLQVESHVGENLPAVRGDPTYLEQVMRNLLTNAVRYGQGLETGVEVTARDTPEGVEVRVLDNGPGLEAEDVEQLFELFYRSPAARLVPGGAGIGLFVCRRLIEAMGGRTWARPRPGGGAEFGIRLPIMESDVA